jgi:putative oxidoreductase
MVCGLLVLVRIWTRAAAMPLLIANLTAIASTKIPELWRPGQGFWYMVTDIRTDFAMLLSLLYLFAAGSGRYTLQEVLGGTREDDRVPTSASREQSA